MVGGVVHGSYHKIHLPGRRNSIFFAVFQKKEEIGSQKSPGNTSRRILVLPFPKSLEQKSHSVRTHLCRNWTGGCVLCGDMCGCGCGVRNGAWQARNVTAQSSWLICGLRGRTHFYERVILEWTVGWAG